MRQIGNHYYYTTTELGRLKDNPDELQHVRGEWEYARAVVFECPNPRAKGKERHYKVFANYFTRKANRRGEV